VSACTFHPWPLLCDLLLHVGLQPLQPEEVDLGVLVAKGSLFQAKFGSLKERRHTLIYAKQTLPPPFPTNTNFTRLQPLLANWRGWPVEAR